VNRVPRWRVAAGALVLAALLAFGALFAPLYVRYVKLQNFVSEMAQNAANRTRPDDVLRSQVLDKAHDLGLPVKEDNVHIIRSGAGMRIDVRYFVRLDLPGYTVNLHFYPGAGSR
jgi:hypothetical protein